MKGLILRMGSFPFKKGPYLHPFGMPTVSARKNTLESFDYVFDTRPTLLALIILFKMTIWFYTNVITPVEPNTGDSFRWPLSTLHCHRHRGASLRRLRLLVTF